MCDEREKHMKIILFGATGRVATRILNEALDRGHQVTAISRDGGAAALPSHDNLTVVSADILNPVQVAEVVTGHDVVIHSVGAPDGAPHDFMVQAAHSLIEGLTRASVVRLLVVGGAGSSWVSETVQFVDTPEFPPSVRPGANDHRNALDIYKRCGLEWTFVSPPSIFPDGERIGKYRTSAGTRILHENGESRITLEDFAVAMIDEAENGQYVRSHMCAAY
jgi:putative NADH-flavin reductase